MNSQHTRERVGKALKKARMDAGLSMGKLKPVIDPAYLCRIENGKTPVGIDTLHKIAEAMNLELHITFISKEPFNW